MFTLNLRVDDSNNIALTPEQTDANLNVCEQVIAGGLTPGVSSFNGRTGDVMPDPGDYPIDFISEELTNEEILAAWNAVMG